MQTTCKNCYPAKLLVLIKFTCYTLLLGCFFVIETINVSFSSFKY